MGCGSSRINPGGDTEAATPRPNPAKSRNGLMPNGESNYNKKANVDTNANISDQKPSKKIIYLTSFGFCHFFKGSRMKTDYLRTLKITGVESKHGRTFLWMLLYTMQKCILIYFFYYCPNMVWTYGVTVFFCFFFFYKKLI
jgi:hypothetical protein